MDSRCIKKSIDFLFPQSKFSEGFKCTPIILVKGSCPSRIKKDKIKLEDINPEASNEKYNFVCSLVQVEDWLSSKTIIANCMLDVEDFDSCAKPDSKLPTKQTFYCRNDKNKATTAIMTPARILEGKNLDVLDFQQQNKKKNLKPDEYYGIIHKWLKQKT